MGRKNDLRNFIVLIFFVRKGILLSYDSIFAERSVFANFFIINDLLFI